MNSLHYPSGSFSEKLPELMDKIKEFDDVVFHCALSQQRGPSSALKYIRISETKQNVWVLRGGFVKWAEIYGKDSTVTDKFQEDIWRLG